MNKKEYEILTNVDENGWVRIPSSDHELRDIAFSLAEEKLLSRISLPQDIVDNHITFRVEPKGRKALLSELEMRQEQEKIKKEEKRQEKKNVYRSWIQLFVAALLGWLFSLISKPQDIIGFFKKLF